MLAEYDIIVVGAGHAGNEAAMAAAHLGSKVLLITMNMAVIGQMSCNPAMGGVAKGQIVREIDALGGYSGIVSDLSAIQFKMLNASKGPAMWSPRTQNDRMLFAETWRLALENNPNLDFWQDTVVDLIVKNEQVEGVKTALGLEIFAKAVILTNGTFLNGIIHIGEKQIKGGRTAEKAATGLTEALQKLGFISGRMKTGTPPRVDGRSLDYTKMEIQEGDVKPQKFSFSDQTQALKKQIPCYLTYTNLAVHDILRTGFEKSPMFCGRIQGLGPRYCPSIEDKITRFAERERHQIFVEPEGWKTVEVYVNGFSTSLPEEVQLQALRYIPGFERAKMFRPGYAIEYDWFPPTQLFHSLETKIIKNLYFAGQINGTTGYEEAAGQGLMAGINAHLKINEKPSFVLRRSEAYIGVLIDDLVLKGTEEPYRMFTSRAEYRVLLRGDNADTRLTPLGYNLGLASEERMRKLTYKNEKSEQLSHLIRKVNVAPEEVNLLLETLNDVPILQKYKALQLLLRPNLGLKDLLTVVPMLKNEVDQLENWSEEIIQKTEIDLKYESYIEKEKIFAEQLNQLENYLIPENFEYKRVVSLSNEAREKLSKHQPQNLSQAGRISGVSPADLSVLLMYLK